MSKFKPVILCVDDESIIVNSLKTELRTALESTFLVETAESGAEALEIVDELLETGYEIPLIISDYIMPEMKGDEVLIKLHSIIPHARKIMLTGQSSVEGITNVINHAKLYRFIAKPWNPNDLAITVREAIKSYFQEVEIENKNKELELLNASLEQKVLERTLELQSALQLNQESKKVIEDKNRNIMDSIKYAQRIQNAMLPQTEYIQQLLPEHFILFQPRDIVSGDFYWVEKVPERFLYQEDETRKVQVIVGFQTEKIMIATVDCTGHGIPGAFMSLIGNDQLNTIVMHDDVVEPASVLENLHKNIRTVLRQHETKNADGMEVSLCSIDKENKKMDFAGTRTPLIYIQNGELHTIAGDRRNIGGYENPKPFTQHSINIDIPTWIYIFSDGIVDQFGGPENKKFSVKRLSELLLSVYQRPFTEQREIIRAIMKDWMSKESQIDDILLFGFKCHAV
jgi:serine phosphatase RsbU (regulator of sigma subunit)